MKVKAPPEQGETQPPKSYLLPAMFAMVGALKSLAGWHKEFPAWGRSKSVTITVILQVRDKIRRTITWPMLHCKIWLL